MKWRESMQHVDIKSSTEIMIIFMYHHHSEVSMSSNSRYVWESMGKSCSCTQFITNVLYYKSRENPYQVLQVTCVRLNVQ